MNRKINSQHKEYFVLLCDDNKFSEKGDKWREPMICGVFASRKEAMECKKEIKDCICKHTIKPCKVQVEYQD